MNSELIPLVVGLIQKVAPALGGMVSGRAAPIVGQIISTVAEATPVLVKEYQDLVPIVRNVIATLKASPVTRVEQLGALEELEARLDAEFDAAAAQALKDDEAGF